jgi:hypothetical protein
VAKIPPLHPKPVKGDDMAEGQKRSARRWMPVDADLGTRKLNDREDHANADTDYYNNLKMPERRVSRGADMHEPNRDKGCEPGHEEAKAKGKK